MKSINKSKLVRFQLPLPPTAEQVRIVATVDKLFEQARELAGRLEAAGSTRSRWLESILADAIQ